MYFLFKYLMFVSYNAMYKLYKHFWIFGNITLVSIIIILNNFINFLP